MNKFINSSKFGAELLFISNLEVHRAEDAQGAVEVPHKGPEELRVGVDLHVVVGHVHGVPPPAEPVRKAREPLHRGGEVVGGIRAVVLTSFPFDRFACKEEFQQA